MSHRIQPPAEFRVVLMFGAFGDAFNCLDCIQPNDRVTAKDGLERISHCTVVTCFQDNSAFAYYYYYYYHHHHLLYAGYLYLYSWDKLCP